MTCITQMILWLCENACIYALGVQRVKWEKDLQYPKSLGSEIRRWKGLWMNIKLSGNSKQKSEIPKTLLEALGACDRDSFQTSISCLLLAAHYLYQVHKQNDPSL